MKTHAVVLLSGGLDSVYNLYAAHQKWPGQVSAITFNYGQRAWFKELKAAQRFTEDLKISLQVIDITNIFQLDASSLISLEQEVPTDEVNIEDRSASEASAKKVWVANRNGVFLNVGACLAEIAGASFLIPGFNAEEADTFPDNSVEYIEKMNECLKMSTANGVQIHCFSQSMDKKEIMAESIKLGVEIDSIWSCYYGADKMCGKCESCLRFERARQSAKD